MDITERAIRTKKRALVVCAAAALLVSGCNSPPTVTPDLGDNPTPIPDAGLLTVELLNTEFAVGEERVVFRLQAPDGDPFLGDSTVETTIYRLLQETDEAVQAASGSAVYFGQGLPTGGAWVIYAPFDSSGAWGIELTARRPDGVVAQGRMDVEVAAQPGTPRQNTAPPSADNPTVDDAPVMAITSDPDPMSELYDMTIGEAAASGRPTVVHFSSPAHCINALCEPVLEEIKAAERSYGDRVNFIHVESRDLEDPTRLSDTATAWGLPSEPWTFILGKGGRVRTRAEGPLDRVELGLLLDRELATP